MTRGTPIKKRKVMVMVNGLPGNMATKVLEHIKDADKEKYPFSLFNCSLTGPEINLKQFNIDGFEINLFKPDEKEKLLKRMIWDKEYKLIAVDASHPSAVEINAEFYCAHRIPFVMLTTGGDQKRLAALVDATKNCAVIAPNMAKQIVAFQWMFELAAKNSPNVFKNYTLEIVESHQKGKADTSGTAKAMVEYFNALGIPFAKEQIVMIRDTEAQEYLGVPEEALEGHGWHTYTLRSPDKSILFRFTHNVNGRDIYALGTLDAIGFLAKKIRPGIVYSMKDVLKES